MEIRGGLFWSLIISVATSSSLVGVGVNGAGE